MEIKIKRKHIFSFYQFVKYLVTFGFDYNMPLVSFEKYLDDFFGSINSKNKSRLDKKIRHYLNLTIKGDLIELNHDAKTYHEIVTLTEFGARYLLNVNDHIKSSILSGIIGAVASAILTAVLAWLL